MKIRLTGIICLITALLFADAANGRPEGDASRRTAGVGFKIGTLGWGGDLTLNMGKKANLRGGINLFNYDDTVDLDEATVDGNIDWQTIPVLLDWHPAASGFRISGGIVFNKNEISMTASPNETLNFQGTDYTVQSLDGEVTFDEISPYLGVGYGDAVGGKGRFRFACDFGVMFHGEPDVLLQATAQNPVVQSQLNKDLQLEKEEFQEDVDRFSVYPVISLGFSFTF